MTLTPTADEMLDLIESQRFMLNVSEEPKKQGEVTIWAHERRWEGFGLRAVLTQAYRDMNNMAAQVPIAGTPLPPNPTTNETP